ncbi:PA2779 family protein [Marinobacter sp. C2H3]|uniref:PA2779 family protein n=1 Tax=Marinobacter sp. C2H3 TaxID=3119003 RepID=UPI003FA5346B
MSDLRRYLKQVSFVLMAVFTLASTFSATAQASMVGTGDLIQQQQTSVDRQQLLNMLDRQDVQEKLTQLGVSKDEVADRVNNLTPSELAQFNDTLSEAPAGEGVVGIIVLFFLVFIVTDMLCATDIFPFVNCIR